MRLYLFAFYHLTEGVQGILPVRGVFFLPAREACVVPPSAWGPFGVPDGFPADSGRKMLAYRTGDGKNGASR